MCAMHPLVAPMDTLVMPTWQLSRGAFLLFYAHFHHRTRKDNFVVDHDDDAGKFSVLSKVGVEISKTSPHLWRSTHENVHFAGWFKSSICVMVPPHATEFPQDLLQQVAQSQTSQTSKMIVEYLNPTMLLLFLSLPPPPPPPDLVLVQLTIPTNPLLASQCIPFHTGPPSLCVLASTGGANGGVVRCGDVKCQL